MVGVLILEFLVIVPYANDINQFSLVIMFNAVANQDKVKSTF